MISSSNIAGWIIAGGASRRMGKDKAALEIGGCSMIDLAARTLPSISEGRISIAGDRREFAPDLPAFPDMGAPGMGPISGLTTALANGNSEWIAVISCDMPFVTGEVFAILASHALPKDDAVVPIQHDGRPQPLCALYRRKPVLSKVRQLIETDDRSLRNLLSYLAIHYIPDSAFSVLPNAENLFFNINSPADYERAKGIAQES